VKRRAAKENMVPEPGAVRGGGGSASMVMMAPIIKVRVLGWRRRQASTIEDFQEMGGRGRTVGGGAARRLGHRPTCGMRTCGCNQRGEEKRSSGQRGTTVG
jgi:hypothetical protein